MKNETIDKLIRERVLTVESERIKNLFSDSYTEVITAEDLIASESLLKNFVVEKVGIKRILASVPIHFVYHDKGTTPAMPPVSSIKVWLQQKSRFSGLTDVQRESVAWAIAKKIAKTGLRRRNLSDKISEALRKKLGGSFV